MVTNYQALHVLMNGIHVGVLEKSQTGSLRFLYDRHWLKRPGARAISLSLPLTPKAYTGDKVYNFFDNLLPDNPSIRSRIQTMFQTSTSQPFDLLASIGRDCIGAIQLTDGHVLFERSIKAIPLSDKEIATVLKDYRSAPLGMTDNTSEFRISIAGAQEKAAFLLHQNQWYRPLGTTPTTHIFKLSIGHLEHHHMDLSDSCENEWLCSKIAEAFDLPTAYSEIHRFDDVKVLVVERFDRKIAKDGTWIIRLPQEDMCQALGYSPNLKYQSDGGPGISEIMTLLLGAKNPDIDRENFFRSQVLFWLLAAIDGHAKNFSVYIEPGSYYSLTPLYDIISAYPLMARKQLQQQKIKMAMALIGKNRHYHWHSIQARHFMSTAKAAKFSIPLAEYILNDMLSKVDKVIEKVADELPRDFPEAISAPIFNGMKKLGAITSI